MSDDLITALSIARQFVPNGTEAAERVDTAMRTALEAQIAAVAPAVDAQPVAIYQVLLKSFGLYCDTTREVYDETRSDNRRIVYTSAQSEGLRKDAVRDGVQIASYCLTDHADVIVQPVRQIAGPDLWAVRHAGNCLGKNGEWEHEPMPSSRGADFLARCRFASAQEAIDAALSQHKAGEKND